MQLQITAHLCECVALLSCALSFAGWVAEGKDNWSLIEGSHVPDDLLRESSSNSCNTWDTRTFRLKAIRFTEPGVWKSTPVVYQRL